MRSPLQVQSRHVSPEAKYLSRNLTPRPPLHSSRTKLCKGAESSSATVERGSQCYLPLNRPNGGQDIVQGERPKARQL